MQRVDTMNASDRVAHIYLELMPNIESDLWREKTLSPFSFI